MQALGTFVTDADEIGLQRRPVLQQAADRRVEREPRGHHMTQNFLELDITKLTELLQGLSPFG